MIFVNVSTEDTIFEIQSFPTGLESKSSNEFSDNLKYIGIYRVVHKRWDFRIYLSLNYTFMVVCRHPAFKFFLSVSSKTLYNVKRKAKGQN